MSHKVLEDLGFSRFDEKEDVFKGAGYLNGMVRTSQTSSSSSCHVSGGNANDVDPTNERVSVDLFTCCDDASFSSTNLTTLNTPYLDQQTGGALDLTTSLQTPTENLIPSNPLVSYNTFSYPQDFLSNEDHLLISSNTYGEGGPGLGEGGNVEPSSSQPLLESIPPFMEPVSHAKHDTNNAIDSSINLEDNSISMSSLLNYEQQQSRGFDHYQNNMGPNYGVYNILGNASSGYNSDGLFMGTVQHLQTMSSLGTELSANFPTVNGNGYGLYGIENNQPQMMYNQSDLHQQVYCDSNPQGVASTSIPLSTTDISGLDDAYKVGKLTPEEKKFKIKKYMKKRNERNFNKTIKYACRKTLADSRPRVRGRFAKNEESTEVKRDNSGAFKEKGVTNEPVVVAEEEITTDPSNIFGDINTYKCNYTIDEWN